MAGRVDDSGLPFAIRGLEDRNGGIWLDEAAVAAEGKVQQNEIRTRSIHRDDDHATFPVLASTAERTFLAR